MSNMKTSIKVSDIGLSFFQKFRTNRRKADVDSADLSYWKLIELIERYFKNNNDKYLELIKMEYKKNV